MSRHDRSTLNEAISELDEAWKAFFIEDTPFTRAGMETATRRFIEVLHPLIGHELTFLFQAAWEGWFEANQRLLSFDAAVASGGASVDANDPLRRGLSDGESVALRRFQDAEQAVKEALDALPAEGAQ